MLKFEKLNHQHVAMKFRISTISFLRKFGRIVQSCMASVESLTASIFHRSIGFAFFIYAIFLNIKLQFVKCTGTIKEHQSSYISSSGWLTIVHHNFAETPYCHFLATPVQKLHKPFVDMEDDVLGSADRLNEISMSFTVQAKHQSLGNIPCFFKFLGIFAKQIPQYTTVERGIKYVVDPY